MLTHRFSWLGAAVVVGMACGGGAGQTGDGGAGVDAMPGIAPWEPTLGAVWETPDTLRIAVASERATRIEAWIYAVPLGAPEALRVVLEPVGASQHEARVGRAALEAAGVTTVYYGLRVWGPNWPYDAAWVPGTTVGHVTDADAEGNRMNPNKLVADPYARELSHDPTTIEQGDFGPFQVGAARGIDSGPVAPKAIALAPPTAADVDLAGRPTRALADDVIYEVHLRGLTRGDAAAGACAGTYAGAASRAASLAELGVTAIELLPIQETWNDRNDVDPESPDGDNYWGYATLGFFAPDRRYACDRSPGGPTRELREMVRTFHGHGIKVFMDVVYNHTAEGSGSSLLSLRGVDNAGYYELAADGRRFVDHNGVGADLATRKPLAGALVLDSLRYFVHGFGIDGFRFDLAPVLGNTCANGCFTFDAHEFPARIARELPARLAIGGAGTDLIAEPWAIGAGTYQVGAFPDGWAEWNGPYRDGVRDDQNRHGVAPVTPGWIADRFAGSGSLFGDDGRGPAASVNFVVAHDGLTHRDLYACERKDNDQAWPWGPSDGGTDDDRAWDQGGEPAAQRQAARTGMAILALSAGVPMITGGDEALRTQRCNNNAYNLDSAAMWLDWDDAPDEAAFRAFTRRLFALRAAHPALRPVVFWTDAEVSWRRGDGTVADAAFLDEPAHDFLGFRLGGDVAGQAIYVAYNGGPASLDAGLPPAPGGLGWHLAVDTGAAREVDGNAWDAGQEPAVAGPTHRVAARSLAVFVAR